MHDRVADDRQLEDLGALDAGLVAERGEQAVERLAYRLGQLHLAARMHHHVAHAAHEVLAEADLRVHDPGTREHRAVGQVHEVAGDRRRADVDGDAERAVVEAGPDRDDVATAVDRDRDAVVARRQRALERADHREVGVQPLEAPFRAQRVEQAAEVPGRRGEIGFRDVDRVQPRHRVEREGARGEVLADDLLVDLALGRHVDDGVAEQRGRARQPAIRGETALRAVRRLHLAGRAQVIGRGGDPVLRERPERRHDRAAAADPAPTTHRIDVHAERPRRIEHRRAHRRAAAPPGRGEDDLRVGGGRAVTHGRPVSRGTRRRPAPRRGACPAARRGPGRRRRARRPRRP